MAYISAFSGIEVQKLFTKFLDFFLFFSVKKTGGSMGCRAWNFVR